MSKTRGKKIIGVRGDEALHAKLGRIVANTGVDKSTVIRTAINWMSEEQIAVIVNARQRQLAVQHGT